jgi:FkbM family methyltransferase
VIRNVNRAKEVFRCRSEVRDWCNVTLAYLGFKRLRYPYCLNVRGLHPIVLYEISDLWAFWQVFLRRVYSVSASDFLILDAGANIGLFALLAARESPSSRIIALEPFPSTFRRLVENVNRNQVADRVTCLNIALADSTELRSMDLMPQFSQRRHLHRQGAERSAEFVSVPTTTLARVLEDQHISRLDLLKLDIEGNEYEVLYSTPIEILQCTRRIALEYHPEIEQNTAEELIAFLLRAGFRLECDIRDSEGYGVAHFLRRNLASAIRAAA